MGLEQKPEESLGDFLDRFRKETIGIEGVSKEMQMVAFSNGVRKGRFSHDLKISPPTALNELFSMAERYYLVVEQEKDKKETSEGLLLQQQQFRQETKSKGEN